MNSVDPIFQHLVNSSKFQSSGHTYYDEGILLDLFLAIEKTAFTVTDEGSAINFMAEIYMKIRQLSRNDKNFAEAIIFCDIIGADDLMNEDDIFEESQLD